MVKESPSLISIITPAFCEEQNLPVLYDRIKAVFDGTDLDWEWVIIDDHSTDGTFQAAADLSQRDSRVRAVRFSRNYGAHIAIRCGLDHALGDAAVVVAADLQDPPEIIPRLIEKWRAGAHVVWAARSQRKGDEGTKVAFSRLYFWLLRRMSGFNGVPEGGADFFLLDRQAINSLLSFKERNISILALSHWIGFRQETIQYERQAREHGRTGWTLAKKIKLILDTFLAFTYLPIRIMSFLGVAIAALGFVYAIVVVINAFSAQPVEGWSSLMVVVLIIGGAQILMLGVLGEYMWRALEETRRRPHYLIEDAVGEVRPDTEDNSVAAQK